MQEAAIPQPGTLVAYQLELDGVVDFSDGFNAGDWPNLFADFACAWKEIAIVERRDPASWLISDMLIKARHCGLLFPSTRRPGGTNLAVFCGNLTAADRILPYDPAVTLPRDQSSWLGILDAPPPRGMTRA